MVADSRISIEEARNASIGREPTKLAKKPLLSGEKVLYAINRAKCTDLRGATSTQLYYIRRHVAYFNKKHGLSQKQLNHLEKTLDLIKPP